MAGETVKGLTFVAPWTFADEAWVPCPEGETPRHYMVFAFIHGMFRPYTCYYTEAEASQYARKLDHRLRGLQ